MYDYSIKHGSAHSTVSVRCMRVCVRVRVRVLLHTCCGVVRASTQTFNMINSSAIAVCERTHHACNRCKHARTHIGRGVEEEKADETAFSTLQLLRAANVLHRIRYIYAIIVQYRVQLSYFAAQATASNSNVSSGGGRISACIHHTHTCKYAHHWHTYMFVCTCVRYRSIPPKALLRMTCDA